MRRLKKRAQALSNQGRPKYGKPTLTKNGIHFWKIFAPPSEGFVENDNVVEASITSGDEAGDGCFRLDMPEHIAPLIEVVGELAQIRCLAGHLRDRSL
jgi:hypothetical protein